MSDISTIRIKNLSTTATSAADDDYVGVDGATNGMRKMLVSNITAEVEGEIGTLSDLTTDDQSDLVSAINEVDANVDANTADIADLTSDLSEVESASNNGLENLTPNATTISGLYISTSGVLTTYTGDDRTICVEAEANKTYRIKKSTSTIMRAGCGTSDSLVAGDSLSSVVYHSSASTDELIVTTDDTYYYIYVQLYATSDSSSLQSIDANTPTLVICEDLPTEVSELQSFVTTTNSHSVINWSQGTITATTGKNTNSTTRCRNLDYLCPESFSSDGNISFTVLSGYKASWREYDLTVDDPDITQAAYTGNYASDWITGTTEVTLDTTKVYRFVCALSDDGTLAPEDVPSNVLIISGKTEVPVYNARTTRLNYFTVEVNSENVNNDNTATTGSDSYTAKDYNAVLALPVTYKRFGAKTKLMIHGHGGTGYIVNEVWHLSNSYLSTVVMPILAEGYAILDVDNTEDSTDGAADEGCLQLMSAYHAAYEYAIKNYNLDPNVVIYADSMGSFAAINIMKWGIIPVRCACISGPRASIEEIYNRCDSTAQAHIASVFEWSDTSSYQTDIMKSYDPYLSIYEDANGDKHTNIKVPPLKILSGGDDTNGKTEVEEFVEALRNSGSTVYYREVTGETHADIVYLSDGTLLNEMLVWLNRF